jgi:peptidoglycan/LPS O-acetylase OafA/YrhL
MEREPHRVRYIDALRGWAILLVLLTHASQGQMSIDALYQAGPQSPALDLPFWLRTICAYAGSGVHLFFVVSALSLALSCRARGKQSYHAYLLRRFFRIAPMFYAGIVLYLALTGTGPRLYAPAGIGELESILTIGFLHIWVTNAMNSVVPGDWSVGVEAMFYLILPVLLLLGRTPLRLAMLTAGFITLAQIIHQIGAGFGPFGAVGFPSQAAVFLFGLIGALASRNSILRKGDGRTLQHLGAASVFLFLVAGLPFVHLPESILVYYVQFAAVACALCILLHRMSVPAVANKPLCWIGRVSFSMYILHFALLAPVMAASKAFAEAINPGFGDTFLLGVYYPLLVIVTIACSLVTYAAIEQPGIRLGRLAIARLQKRSGDIRLAI